MLSRACRDIAKHTPFLLSELGPRNAATEEELRNAREKMLPNLMPNNGPRAARISEWEKSGVDSSFISSGRSWHTMSKRMEARQLLTSGIPTVSAKPCINETLLLYRGEKSEKPHRTNHRNRQNRSLPIKRQKNREMSGKSCFF